MKINEIKDLILFCKQQGVEYIEVGNFKASIPNKQPENQLPGKEQGFTPAGLFDHLDGEDPNFTPLPKEDD